MFIIFRGGELLARVFWFNTCRVHKGREMIFPRITVELLMISACYISVRSFSASRIFKSLTPTILCDLFSQPFSASLNCIRILLYHPLNCFHSGIAKVVGKALCRKTVTKSVIFYNNISRHDNSMLAFSNDIYCLFTEVALDLLPVHFGYHR